MKVVGDVTTQAKLRVERARARYGWFDIAVSTFKRYSTDDGGSYAAALTYYLFFSIFPLLLAGIAVLALATKNDPELRTKIIKAGLDSIPAVRDLLQPDGLGFIEERASGLALTAVALAAYTGSGAIVALEHALNKVNHLAEEGTFVQKRLRSLRWLGLLGVIGLLSAGLGVLANVGLFEENAVLSTTIFVLAYAGGVLVGTALFATAFKFLPAESGSWREVLPGAVAAAVAFEILKVAVAIYLKAGTATREATFGTFAAAAGLLVFSYFVSQLTLMAAELNAVLAERRATRQSQVVESAAQT